MIDPIKIMSIAGTREMYTLILINRETGKAQVAGPKLNRFFGGSFELAYHQIDKLPPSVLQTASMSKGEPGYFAYLARPLPNGGLKVQAPLPEYSHFSVVLYGVDELCDYVATVLKAPLYVPDGGLESEEDLGDYDNDEEDVQTQSDE